MMVNGHDLGRLIEPAFDNEITIDLTKLINLAMTQVDGAVDPLLLQQWANCNSDVAHPVIVNLAAVSVENETEPRESALTPLKIRINDVITFSDNSELRIHALTQQDTAGSLAFDAYCELLSAISNI